MFDSVSSRPVTTDKQKFAYIVQEALGVQLAAQAGMTPETSTMMVNYLDQRHQRARMEAARIAEEVPEIKALGKAGQAPLMSVFYTNSAQSLRQMAKEWVSIPNEEDREFLLMVADSRESIAHALNKDFKKAEEAAELARERGFTMIAKKCPTEVGKRGQA